MKPLIAVSIARFGRSYGRDLTRIMYVINELQPSKVQTLPLPRTQFILVC